MKLLLLGFVAAGTVAGLGFSYLVTPVWRTTAALRIDNRGDSDLRERSISAVMSRRSLAIIINDPRLGLYERERRNMPLKEVVDKMRRNIHFEVMPGHPEVFTLQFDYFEPIKAVEATNVLMSRLAQAVKTPRGTSVTVVDLPAVPKKPLSPSRAVIALAGTVAGLVLGLATLLIRRRMSPGGQRLQPA
jgi:hypothetical protein